MIATRGCTRLVLLLGNYAFKFPNPLYEWKHFLQGLIANMQERNFSRTGWPELCPVKFSIPGGWLVVMSQARPLTDLEFETLLDEPQDWRERGDYVVPCELKQDSFGWIGTRLVAIDYGN